MVYRSYWCTQDLEDDLEAEVKAAKESLDTHHNPPDVVQATAALARMSDILDDMRRRAWEKEVTKTTSDVAQQVFAIPEITEQVLSNLTSRDLFSAYSVNHTFEGVSKGSIKLQFKLGLRAQFDVTPYSPTEHFSSWLFNFDKKDGLWLNSIDVQRPDSVTIQLVNYRGPWQKLGKRRASVLLSQPPVYRLDVSANCCRMPLRYSAPDHMDSPLETITAKEGSEGITVGDVHQVLTRLWPQHRLCLYASDQDHNAAGEVNVRLTFEGCISMSEGHPWLMERASMRRKEAKRRRLALSVQDYMAVKVDASNKGQPIPTYAEFEARQIELANSGLDGEDSEGHA
ncbi:uncharacterized protein LTR77_001574 [Saxophila tyrrhenica]|uniref:F-box domain-containing protein n=1 Tax=Saxophila tyrrhenica TaxID=1690608 RepID=A0AAV9PLW5_9PEZI|nr:hypothetical protein LTR77_001574 [Saxophila tyrrhenica]